MTSSKRIAGVDEVGRGPLAGPVVGAACVFPEGYSNSAFKDSKQLRPKKREQLIDEIQRAALGWAIVAVSPLQIDRINIREAAKLAMSLALRQVAADAVLVDGNMALDTELPQRTVVGGDALHVEISAASILAKVWRDRLMAYYDTLYPGYSLAAHAGYPTASHREAIARLGPSPIHRLSFGGVREHAHRVPAPRESAENRPLPTLSWSLG